MPVCRWIATNVGGTPELVVDDVTGILSFTVANPPAMADAILGLVASPARMAAMGDGRPRACAQRLQHRTQRCLPGTNLCGAGAGSQRLGPGSTRRRHGQPHPRPETVRGFWHGLPLGPCQLLCLRSFVDRGHRIELYTYDETIAVPDWIVRRDAREILPTDMFGLTNPGSAAAAPRCMPICSATPCSIVLRLVVDLDVLLLSGALPTRRIFLPLLPTLHDAEIQLSKFPPGDPALRDAVDACNGVAEADAVWGQTGPLLLTSVVDGTVCGASPSPPIRPIRSRGRTCRRCSTRPAARKSTSASGAPYSCICSTRYGAAPGTRRTRPAAGSFLDACFRLHDFGHHFREVMNFADVIRWIGNRHDKIMLEETVTGLEHKYQALERHIRRWRTNTRRLRRAFSSCSKRTPPPLRDRSDGWRGGFRDLLGRAGSPRQ